MKKRVALKVRNRFHKGHYYRQTTVKRMRKRLMGSREGTDATLWFTDLLDRMHREAPIELAALRFHAGMNLATMKSKQKPDTNLDPYKNFNATGCMTGRFKNP